MPNWKNTLDIKEIWEKADGEEISPKETANKIAEQIKLQLRHLYKNDETLQNICEEFEEFDSDNFDDFDIIFNDLYDWGDYNHTCWIKTQF